MLTKKMQEKTRAKNGKKRNINTTKCLFAIRLSLWEEEK
jgi:hypothetical protein